MFVNSSASYGGQTQYAENQQHGSVPWETLTLEIRARLGFVSYHRSFLPSRN
jgi:hypothetical protein